MCWRYPGYADTVTDPPVMFEDACTTHSSLHDIHGCVDVLKHIQGNALSLKPSADLFATAL
jgi:hypothetical protein